MDGYEIGPAGVEMTESNTNPAQPNWDVCLYIYILGVVLLRPKLIDSHFSSSLNGLGVRGAHEYFR